ncbi:MAG: hypothetical protein IKO34_04895 [Bacteroidales bacterium]|nr:hypothetical protein [Bacteroidales bacterium]
MLNLGEFISGYYHISGFFSMILETIRPTNLDRPFSWLKVLIEGSFQQTIGNVENLAVSIGQPMGQLGYNAQYPYLQKALRTKLNNSTILVYDGTALTPLIVNPTNDQDTLVIDDVIIVHPCKDYRMVPFIIHSATNLSSETRDKIKAETEKLKLSSTRYTIDAPNAGIWHEIEIRPTIL